MSDGLDEPAAADGDFPRSITGVAHLVRHARTRGVAARSVLVGTGLGPADLAQPGREVTAAQELQVVRRLHRLLGEVGGEVGAGYRVTTFGAFGYAILTSRTVLDAMNVALRFLDLSFAFAIPRADLVGSRVVITVDGAALPADVRRFLVERDAVAVRTVLESLVPGGVGSTLALGEGSVEAVIELDAAELARPLPRVGDDPEVSRALCADLVARRRSRTGIAQDVRVLVAQQLDAGAPMARVAGLLGLSERTLRRRLAAADTSYQALLDEVRESLARDLLDGRATLPVADLAQRLGYAEASSFIHAFRRWTGTTPAAYAVTRR